MNAPRNPAILPSRRLFAANMKRREERIDLGLAALLIAKEEYPRLVLEDYLERLDILASGLAVELDLEAPGETIASTIGEFLGEQEGFEGDRDDYYNPRNSYLSEVMDRRQGLPISLSMLYMEVGRRAGVHLLPVPMPAHFIVTGNFSLRTRRMSLETLRRVSASAGSKSSCVEKIIQSLCCLNILSR